MNAMERLKVAIEIAEQFAATAKQDEQGCTTWIEAVGRLGRELHDTTEFFMPAPVEDPQETTPIVLSEQAKMQLEAKRNLIRKALHTAWGNAKASPDYQKCWWRVISAVLENLTHSQDPAAIKILNELTIPSDPERPT